MRTTVTIDDALYQQALDVADPAMAILTLQMLAQ